MAAVKKITIHAGFHRCASTATQDLLRRHRAEIEASGGALLLREDLSGWLTGRQLRLLYRHRRGSLLCKARLALVRRMLAGVKADRIFISEELLLGLMPGVRDQGFYPHFGNFLLAVKDLSRSFDVALRFVVRRQDHFLESAYAFRVPRGLRKSLPDYVATIGPGNVSWFRLLTAIEDAGLGDQCRFMPLEGLKRGDGSAMLRFLGVDGPINEKRRFGRGNPRRGADELRRLLGGDTQVAFTDEDRAALLALHQDGNRAFLKHAMVHADPAVWDDLG